MKNKEVEEILHVLKDIVIGRATRLTCREADKLLSYIEQLENNRDKAIERCEFWLDFYRNVNNNERIILRLNDILSKLKGDSDDE